jgi:hypothetical protein
MSETLQLTPVEIGGLLNDALACHSQCLISRTLVSNHQQEALWYALLAGYRLLQLKQIVPVGEWTDWLTLNFCSRIQVAPSTAFLYLKIANDNAELLPQLQRTGVSAPDPQLLGKLKFDTVRKYAIGFVPAKEQPHEGRDITFPRSATFLNISNEYDRLKYRHINGLQEVDFDEAREETLELYAFLHWLHRPECDAAQPCPWSACPP